MDLIEIGCGNGITLLQLASDFATATGLEYMQVHQTEFDALRKQFPNSAAQFKQWDISAKPFTPVADRLISFEVIEHLPNDSNVENYAKSLKPGAICAITVPNKWWIFETHGAKLPLLPWNRVPFFSWLPKPIHEKYALARIYTKRRIVKLLELYGFEIIDTCFVTAPMDVVKWKPLQKLLRSKFLFGSDTTWLPFKAVSIFVIAKKK